MIFISDHQIRLQHAQNCFTQCARHLYVWTVSNKCFQVVCCGASLEPNVYLSLLGRSNGRNMSNNERRRKPSCWELEGALLWLQINSLTFCKYSFILNLFCKYFYTVLPTLVKRSFSALNFIPKSLYNSVF